ncbi:flavin-containing monooxygenase [Congregibacter sp.]|uniref:flavin-containing monooxygenase n=1 Tax=Congregibacter sp. TaxID=2744308 RepID=UPI00385CB17E
MASQQKADYDVIAIGAGFAGLACIHYIREAGLSIKVFDRASDIGGTWTWNRYPGAMTDSESYYYCLTFSKELLQKWSWSRRYPDWSEALSYFHFVADECDMWKDIQLNTEIVSADYQAKQGHWLVKTAAGESFSCKYLISSMGMISEPVIPKTPGMDSFKGPIFHSSRWPEDLQWKGKRIGIIGAGATTVQMTPAMAEDAKSVTVFQRTPNFILPAMQEDVTPEREKEIKDNYDEIVETCRRHSFGMAFNSPAGRNLMDTPADEVEKIFEENWKGSFRWFFETFDDLLVSEEANTVAARFITRKMRERINDPAIADLLVPKIGEYPLFAKRPPLDHGYLEAFNRDDVHLVDIRDKEPLVEITETGIRTTENHYEFDIIVIATGFAAYTGALEAFPIRGLSGQSLKEKWTTTSNAIMGMCIADFPNLFTITGPQAPFANLPTSIEQNAMYAADCIKKMEAEGYDVMAPKIEAEEEWSAHVTEVHKMTLMDKGDSVHSWMMGANIEKHTPRVLIYFGGADVYYDKLRESVDAGFPEMEFQRLAS